jgi:hypothetical protein
VKSTYGVHTALDLVFQLKMYAIWPCVTSEQSRLIGCTAIVTEKKHPSQSESPNSSISRQASAFFLSVADIGQLENRTYPRIPGSGSPCCLLSSMGSSDLLTTEYLTRSSMQPCLSYFCYYSSYLSFVFFLLFSNTYKYI